MKTGVTELVKISTISENDTKDMKTFEIFSGKYRDFSDAH